jgi:hypothetical protein
MGTLWERKLGILAGVWVHVDFGKPVGVPALSVRHVELLRQFWLGMGSGNGRMQSVVEWRRLLWPQHRSWLWGLSAAVASAPAASSVGWRRVDSGESAAFNGHRQPAGAGQDWSGDDCRAHGDSNASFEFASSIRSFGFRIC